MANKVYLTETEWGQITAKAWRDAAFRHRLESDPEQAIRDAFPDFEFQRVFQIADPPEDLTEEQLESVSDGEGKALLLNCVATIS